MNEMPVCPHCGHVDETGDPVITRQVYVSGRGMTTVTGCLDLVRCWGRWDAAHGWPEWDEQVRRTDEWEERYRGNH